MRTVAAIACCLALASAARAQLVINEVDYDTVGTDTAEFIELLNTSGASVYLGDYSVVLVNGASNSTYAVYPLPARWLPGGARWVMAGASGTIPGVTQVIAPATNIIQNGAPDGIALVNTATSSLADALSYEGCMTAATVTGLPGLVNLVEGSCIPGTLADSNTVASLSFSRTPDGQDTNISASDWTLAPATPGSANGSACAGILEATVAPTLWQVCPQGGAPLDIVVSPVGIGSFTYQWYRDGVELFDTPDIAGSQGQTLRLYNPGAAYAGTYDCLINDGCTTMLSDACVVQSCIADITCSDGIDLADFFDFLTCFDQTLDCADIDGTPGVDLGDFFSFLTAFDQGC